jgi:asparagine synthase (glutamine-hydrolysing)
MCGIWGVWGGQPNVSMARALDHRGPDDQGSVWLPNGPTLGHNRLAIIDTSAAGAQPMQRGPLTITYNGEIYNFKELREIYNRETVFHSGTDTETLLELWRGYGPNCLHMLDGMFSFAIWDSVASLLTLVRDRAGEKPLYWTHQNGIFAFASELRALQHIPGLSWEIDEVAFGEYMALRYVPAPRSIIKGIHKLEPGHYLTFDGKTVKTRRWYAWEVRPQPDATVSQKGFRDAVDATEAALIESIRGRLISDRPLGMFLSGGIDSSLVCAIAAKRLNVTPKTFSIGFEGPKSEHVRAAQTARMLGCEHHEHMFTTEDFENVGNSIGATMDEPNGDRSCVPTYLLSRFAQQFVTVSLSGDGGDELFGGYSRYAAPCDSSADYYNRLLPVAGIEWAPHQQAGSLFAHPNRHPIHALRQLDFERYLTLVLAKMDRMSMQHSLEVRTPYLSPAMLDIARTLPTGYLMQGNLGKLVLRELAAKYIDRDLAGAPKQGFGMPGSVFEANGKLVQEQWAQAVCHPVIAELTGGRLNGGNINTIWAVIVFAQWARSMGL